MHFTIETSKKGPVSVGNAHVEGSLCRGLAGIKKEIIYSQCMGIREIHIGIMKGTKYEREEIIQAPTNQPLAQSALTWRGSEFRV